MVGCMFASKDHQEVEYVGRSACINTNSHKQGAQRTRFMSVLKPYGFDECG